MIEIIPAIMPTDYEDLVEKVGLVAGVVPLVQIDIMDGKFVPGKTWPFNFKDEYNFTAICREEEGMPLWDKIDYELDLMVSHPDESIEQWMALGPKRIVLHLETMKDPEQAFIDLQSAREFIEIGMAFDDEYDVTEAEKYIPYVDFVQFMGIDQIGAQGEPFSERALENLSYFRKKYPNVPFSVDGSVNAETAEILVGAGATRLVVGSAIFGHGDAGDNIDELENLVQ